MRICVKLWKWNVYNGKLYKFSCLGGSKRSVFYDKGLMQDLWWRMFLCQSGSAVVEWRDSEAFRFGDVTNGLPPETVKFGWAPEG